MKRTLAPFGLFLLLSAFGWSMAQELYQVPGFPPFAPAPTMLEVVEDRGETVLVRHLMGETEVPKQPQRVYADASTLETLVSLGIVPVAANYIDYTTVPPALAEATEDTTLNPRSAYDPETVLAAQPDLIVVFDFGEVGFTSNRVVYEQLSAVAPTIVPFAEPFGHWQQATRDLGNVLGLEKRVQDVLARYEERVGAQCERVRSVVGDETVSVVQMYGETFSLIGPGYLDETLGYVPYSLGKLYSECGLTPGAEVAQLLGTDGANQISLERLPELRADHLLVYLYPDGGDAYAALAERRLWRGLPAVQRGNVHVAENYSQTVGYYSTLAVFEGIADAIADQSER